MVAAGRVCLESKTIKSSFGFCFQVVCQIFSKGTEKRLCWSPSVLFPCSTHRWMALLNLQLPRQSLQVATACHDAAILSPPPRNTLTLAITVFSRPSGRGTLPRWSWHDMFWLDERWEFVLEMIWVVILFWWLSLLLICWTCYVIESSSHTCISVWAGGFCSRINSWLQNLSEC